MRFVAGLAVAGAVAMAACGSDDRVADVESAIARILAERLEEPPGEVVVVCPDEAELDAGSTLQCEVRVGDAAAVPVDLTIGEGGTAQLVSAVIPTRSAEDYLAGELSGPAEGAVEVGCGDAPMVVGAVGDKFACDAVRSADAAAFVVTVEIVAIDGTVRYQVASTTTATTTPPPTAAP